MSEHENKTKTENEAEAEAEEEVVLSKKDYLLESIGFILGIIDQVSDILVIFTNQFAAYKLQLTAIIILAINFFLINLFCFFQVIQCSYWKPTVQKNSEKKNCFINYLFKIFNCLFLILNYIVNFLVCQSFAVIIVWFGLTKLIIFDIRIQNFMSEVFLKDYYNSSLKNMENSIQQPSQQINKIYPVSTNDEKEQIQTEQIENQQIQPQDKKNNDLEQQKKNETESNVKIQQAQKQQLVNFQLTVELIEKLFENIPQLVLQIVNQVYGGSQNQVLNKLSIISSVLNIIFNIFVAFKMQNQGFQKWFKKTKQAFLNHMKNIMDKLYDFLNKYILKNIRPALLAISILYQTSIYILVAVSYKWNDYADDKIQSFGKDTDDGIRTFIIVFPVAFLFCVIFKDQVFGPFIFWPLKDIVFFQYFVDALAFHPDNLNYGQKDIGDDVFILFSVLGFLSITINQVEFFIQDKPFYFNLAEQWDKFGKNEKLYTYIFQVFLYLSIKSFQQFINYAHYYIWEEDNCSERFKSLIRAYLITYFFKFLIPILSFIYVAIILDDRKFYKRGIKSLPYYILLLSQVMFIILDSILLSTIINESPCVDLLYVQKHQYNTIFEIGFDLYLVIVPIYIIIYG